MSPRRTTNKEFELFKEYADELIELLGLTDWEITYGHGGTNKESMAECHYSVGARCATIRLTDKWEDDYVKYLTKDDIRKAAYHEVFHALFARLQYLAEERYIIRNQVDEEVHSLIQRLTNMMMKLWL